MIDSIESAIKHCEEVAEEHTKYNFYGGYESCDECASEYRQLAKWLRELKDYKDRQDLINKSWQELINYREGIEKIKICRQAYRERGESILASGMEQALDILEEVSADV